MELFIKQLVYTQIITVKVQTLTAQLRFQKQNILLKTRQNVKCKK